MKQLICECCKAPFAMGTMLEVLGRPLCAECGKREVEEGRKAGKILPGSVVRLADPTVCSRCGCDNGEMPLEKVAGLPACEDCRERFRHFPFPAWIKAALLLVVALAIFSFALNLRFFQGYLHALQAGRAFKAGRIGEAAFEMAAASSRVPESKQLAAASCLYRGLRFLSEDRPAQALPLLREHRSRVPADRECEKALLWAECRVAYDEKDYDRFLTKAKENLALCPKDSGAMGTVASAYACKYALTGQEEFKQEALRHLEQAVQGGAASPAMKDFEERIRFRLRTRQILSRKDYEEKVQSTKAEKESRS